jgi:hypothetical protein
MLSVVTSDHPPCRFGGGIHRDAGQRGLLIGDMSGYRSVGRCAAATREGKGATADSSPILRNAYTSSVGTVRLKS